MVVIYFEGFPGRICDQLCLARKALPQFLGYSRVVSVFCHLSDLEGILGRVFHPQGFCRQFSILHLWIQRLLSLWLKNNEAHYFPLWASCFSISMVPDLAPMRHCFSQVEYSSFWWFGILRLFSKVLWEAFQLKQLSQWWLVRRNLERLSVFSKD